MKIDCVIIDDEPLAIQVIEQYISNVPDLALAASFQNPITALSYVQDHNVDLLILDIQMPLLTGIELVKALSDPPKVIFTTAFRDFAPESYELAAVDYLLKPIAFPRFLTAISKFRAQEPQIEPSRESSSSSDSPDFMFLNSNKKYIKVSYDDILYVESVKDYVRVHTRNGSIVTKDRISAFADLLPSTFLRVHRSYIVNCVRITAFTARDIELEGKEIPIGESYKKEVLDFLKK